MVALVSKMILMNKIRCGIFVRVSNIKTTEIIRKDI